MKRKNQFGKLWLYTLLLLVGVTSCQSDDKPSVEPPIESKTLTFILPNHQPFIIPKSSTTSDEDGSTSDKIVFYQFDNTNKFEYKYVVSYAEGVSETEKTRSYSLDINQGEGGEKRFVIVQSKQVNNFPSLTAKEVINDLLNSKTVEEKGILTAPFVMSNSKSDDKAYITISDINDVKAPIQVELKRRVARFDMLNNSEISGLKIDKIYIKNRRTQGFIGDVDGNAENVATDVLEIPATSLANGGVSFYLYPTELTSETAQNTKTVVWATTKLTNIDGDGPRLLLNMTTDMTIEANRLYELNVTKSTGSMGFDVTVADWEDGTSLDWITSEEGVSTMDSKAIVTEGTEIKGTHIKIPADATLPYIITKVKTDNNPINRKALCDGQFPSWLSVSSSTMLAGNSAFRHEITYTVTEIPGNKDFFAITYLTGSDSDEDLLVIGFADPYPGTPLPCLSWGDKLYSPTHAKQTTYLKHNNIDKAYYAGNTGYTFNKDMAGISNSASVNPCPEGWSPLNDTQAEDYLRWVGDNLKGHITQSIYSYRWFDKDDEATFIRILGGYPKSGTPNAKDIAVYGTWPNTAWIEINLPALQVGNHTFGNQWSIANNYGIPYRCIRSK